MDAQASPPPLVQSEWSGAALTLGLTFPGRGIRLPKHQRFYRAAGAIADRAGTRCPVLPAGSATVCPVNHRDFRGRVRLQRATVAARARPSLALHPRAEPRGAEQYRQHGFRFGEATATSSTTNSGVWSGARALLPAKRRCHVPAGRATPWTLIDNRRSPATTPTRKLMSTVSPIEVGEQPYRFPAELAWTAGIPHRAALSRRYAGAFVSR